MNYSGKKTIKTLVITAALSAAVMMGASAADVKGGIVMTDSSLNFRSAPSTAASVIDQIDGGSRVCVLGVENGWASVALNGTVGYVSADYLDIWNVMGLNGGSAQVTASSLNVRSNPSIDASVVTQLSQGETVTITGINNGWYGVSFSGGAGFVHPDYIKLIPSADNSAFFARSEVISFAKRYIGTRYVYGGSSPSGFDCSGYTSYVFSNFGINLSHSSSAQYSSTARVSRGSLQAGDLVFFTNGGSGVGHVGIYVGNNQFIHSPSPGKSVCIDTMASGYYASHYVGAGRVLD